VPDQLRGGVRLRRDAGQLRRGDRLEEVRRRREAGHGVVVSPQQARHGDEPGIIGEPRRVRPARHLPLDEGEHFAALRVEPEEARRAVEADGLKVRQDGVD
jgi:hypothetical protein